MLLNARAFSAASDVGRALAVALSPSTRTEMQTRIEVRKRRSKTGQTTTRWFIRPRDITPRVALFSWSLFSGFFPSDIVEERHLRKHTPSEFLKGRRKSLNILLHL